MSISRRRFILGTVAVGGGLMIAYGATRPSKHLRANREHADDNSAFLTTWLKINTDNTVTVYVPHAEMGQGVLTSLPIMAADELDADWERVNIEHAPTTKLFANGVLVRGFVEDMGVTVPGFLDRLADFGTMKVAEVMNLQITGGSTSVRFTGEHGMRVAGAAARELLVRTAAERWDVSESSLVTRQSHVYHEASGRSASYGELAQDAARFEPPRHPTLKTPDQFTLMGRSIPRVDIPSKVDGSALFGVDARPEGMLYAAVKTAPVFGSKLASVDNADRIMSRRGVQRVVELDNAVAVVADNYWRAQQALNALEVSFTATDNDTVDSAAIFAAYDDALDNGRLRRDVAEGDTAEAMVRAERIVTASYRVPYLAHAAMEPMNCTVHFHDDLCEVWTGTQDNLGMKARVASVAGINADRVVMHPHYLGGGFGRRLPMSTNTIDQAVEIARHFDVPVQTLWSREEDTRQDYYRPAVTSRFRAGFDGEGNLVAWENRYIGKNEPAEAAHIPYAVLHQKIDYVESDTHVPFGAWRSVAHSQHSFFLESFVDELAWDSGRDPYQFRLDLLADRPRHAEVLRVAAERAGWGRPLPEGRARGIALQQSFGSIVAQVAEVSLDDNGAVKVDRVVCAIDCGRAVHPDTAKQQVESGIIYGLTAALYGRISIENGRVKEGNFNDYEMLRMAQSPLIEVELVESGAALGGLGEPATPPISAAVTNALYALTGQRVRELPLKELRFTAPPQESPAV